MGFDKLFEKKPLILYQIKVCYSLMSDSKNLRKFLESDDPALIRMGFSMAKGMGVSDEMLMEILWMYMFHDDKTVRAAAKSTFIKLAPKDAKQVVKENWKASYRTDFISSDFYGRKSNQYGYHLGILGKALCQTSLGQMVNGDSPELHKFIESDDPAMRRMGMSMAKGSGVPAILYRKIFSISLWDIEEENREFAGELIKEIGLEKIPEFPFVRWLTKVLRVKDNDARRNSVQALEAIGDVRAVEPLIKALKDSVNDVRQAAAKALETFGEVQAVDSLIKLLERPSSRESAAQALGTIGDERAIEPLIMALRDKNGKVSPNAAKALVQFGESVRKSLLSKLEDEILSDSVAEILEKLGKPAVKPLIQVLNDGSPKARNAAVEALGNIGDRDAVKPLIELLADKDNKLRFNAVEALGKIGDELAVKPLIALLRDKDRSVSLSAAEALASSWTNTDEFCKPIIEAFEEDWVIAGLVAWSGSEILYKYISEKLSSDSEEASLPLVFDEILLNHWKNVSVSKKFIRSRSGSYRVGEGVLDICKRKTMCRGSVNITSNLFPTFLTISSSSSNLFGQTVPTINSKVGGKKCKNVMSKGDLRLGVELPNPNNPQYLTTYYYCASCVSTYIDIQKRYDVIEKWWPQSLKAAQIANQRQIKEQAKEQAEKEKKAELVKAEKELAKKTR